jgi:hypothetical protein
MADMLLNASSAVGSTDAPTAFLSIKVDPKTRLRDGPVRSAARASSPARK